MGMLQNLAMGFGIALTPLNLLFIVLGQLVGVSVGILPGINASNTESMGSFSHEAISAALTLLLAFGVLVFPLCIYCHDYDILPLWYHLCSHSLECLCFVCSGLRAEVAYRSESGEK